MLTRSQEWALIVSRAIDAYRCQGLRNLTSADSQGMNSDLSLVFAHQLEKWRTDVTTSWARASGRPVSGDISSRIDLFDRYSRLVVQSLALQQALNSMSPSLPLCFAEVSGLTYLTCALTLQYQSCAVELVDVVGGLGSSARGAPDFVHAAMTYAATSLLRCTQSRFSHLHINRQSILATARRAAALLAEAAIGPDHIAAVQSAFLSRLILSRDQPEAHMAGASTAEITGVSPQTGIARPFQSIDFEAFARALDTDPSMTTWPPVGPMRDKPSQPDTQTASFFTQFEDIGTDPNNVTSAMPG